MFYAAERLCHRPPAQVEDVLRTCFTRLILKTTISRSAAFIMINKRGFHGVGGSVGRWMGAR